MEGTSVLIATNSETGAEKLRAILIEAGYLVTDWARDGHECLRKLRILKPDILVADYGLQDLNGLEVAKVALEDELCDVVLIVSDGQSSLVDDLREENGFACLIKPFNKALLTSLMELMVKNRRRVNQLEKEILNLKSTLDTRKELDKAKGLLMKHLNLSEDEAYRRIQKRSMDSGLSMKEIARSVIIAYDI